MYGYEAHKDQAWSEEDHSHSGRWFYPRGKWSGRPGRHQNQAAKAVGGAVPGWTSGDVRVGENTSPEPRTLFINSYTWDGIVLGFGRVEPGINKGDVSEPPYLDRCRAMDFYELYLFITESLEKQSDSTLVELPRTHEEFENLLEMLIGKADPSASKRTSLTEGKELRSLHDKRERTEEFLEEQYSYANIKKRKKNINNAKRTLNDLGEEISKLKSVIELKGNSYRQVRFPKPLTQPGMVVRLRRKVERHFVPEVEMIQVQWDAVPSGPAPVDSVKRIYTEKQRKSPNIRYDESRLEKAKTLRPNKGYMGRQKSEGYVIFTFDYTQKALMECPVYGNAIFIINSNLEPEHWLQMNKQELIEHPDVIKIPHRGEHWFERAKEELGTPADDF